MQRVALRLIYGVGLSYKKLLKEVNLETLVVKRERRCLEFVQKAIKHSKFENWFKQVNKGNLLEKAKFTDTIPR